MELIFGLFMLVMLGLFALGAISGLILWMAVILMSLVLGIIGFFLKWLPWLLLMGLIWWGIDRVRSREGAS